MKPVELMIGDWVKISSQFAQIYSVEHNTIGVLFSDGYDVFEPQSIEPVPLTNEILEASGFFKDTDDETVTTYHTLVPTGYEKYSFTIKVTLYKEPICGVHKLVKCWGWIPPYNGGLNDIHLCSVNYVHQLQHALRLCGVDMVITLKL